MRITLTILAGFLALPCTLSAQWDTPGLTDLALSHAFEHATQLADGMDVRLQPSQVRIFTSDDRLGRVQAAADRFGAKIGSHDGAITCDNNGCRTVDGTRVVISVGEPEVEGNLATVDIAVTVLWHPGGSGMIYTQSDQFHYIRSGETWTLERIQNSFKT